MPLPIKGDAYAAAIGEVMDAFGPHAKHLVFVGSVVLVLYPPVPGVSLPLRPTKDVDCVSTLKPWILQQKIFEELIGRKVISPDMETAFRYRIRATGIMVDVLSPEGINLGGTTNRWIQEGARRAGGYRLPDGRSVRALTPPYLLMTKIEALSDRGEDLMSSVDAEDIVTLAVEVPDLFLQVEKEGLVAQVPAEIAKVRKRYSKLSAEELLEFHLDAKDRPQTGRVRETLEKLLES